MSGLSDVRLPKGWARATLGEIATWGSGGTPKSSVAQYYGGAIPWVVSGDLNDKAIHSATNTITPEGLESSSAKWVPEGSVLIAMYGATIGKLAITGRPLTTNQAVAFATPNRKVIDERFLFWYMRSQRDALRKTGKGGAQPNISQTILKAWPVAVPPLAEQYRIIEALEDHLSRLDAAQSWLGLAQAKSLHLQSLLYGHTVAGAFSRPVRVDEAPQVDEIRRASSSRVTRRWKPTTISTIPGYTLPDNWTMVSLGDLSYASGYGTSTKCDYHGAGRPVLRIPNVQDGSINLSDLKRAIDPSLDLAHYSLEPGDLLFVRTNGSRKLIGRVGVVEESLPHAFASYLIRFRLTPGIVEPRWVQLVTQSPLWRQTLERYAASSAGQYNLSAETLSHLPVPVPPLAVQRETLEVVSAALDRATRLSAATELATARGKHLRGALLNRALTGHLVPQDPADEPASVLLDRIRAEREAESRSGKGKARRAPRRPRKATTTDAAPPPPPSSTSIPAQTHAVQQELPL
ncbi:restriction endonuclease subunit S [Streptomyces asiaticus]|uniref:restriction endonuclease subunit S n=1 Tax=Streptomyces asiaticus TaxID=114695 RepID=UPI003D74A89D